MIFSPQKWFCNCCGTEMFTAPCNALIAGHGRSYRVCSVECSREMQWRDTLSIMGKEYYPKEELNDGAVRRLVRGEELRITAQDIEVAARGMEAHNKLLEPKSEDDRSDIEKAADRLGGHLLQLAGGTTNGSPGLSWSGVSEAPALGASPSAE